MAEVETCEQCGVAFTRARSSARFCSRRCQRLALARQDRAARALWRAASRIILATAAAIDLEGRRARLGKSLISSTRGDHFAHQRPPQEVQAQEPHPLVRSEGLPP